MDFYAQFRKLALAQPRNATTTRSVENCTFADYVQRSKNLYLSFFADLSQDCFYSEYLFAARDCIDCAYLTSCELCYECVDCGNLYQCSFLQDCHNCSHVDFSFDCVNCKNCFGCFGLRQQQFCIFNKTYNEAEYIKRVQELKKNSPAKIRAILFEEFRKSPRLFMHSLKAKGRCFGDYIYNSNNCFQCYNVCSIDSSAYINDMLDNQHASGNCIDCTFGAQLDSCYECHNATECSGCNFLEGCSGCSDCEYLINCYDCSNCFGCVGLIKKEYCVLNKQFTREEYLIGLQKIKQDLKKLNVYGKSLAEILK